MLNNETICQMWCTHCKKTNDDDEISLATKKRQMSSDTYLERPELRRYKSSKIFLYIYCEFCVPISFMYLSIINLYNSLGGFLKKLLFYAFSEVINLLH